MPRITTALNLGSLLLIAGIAYAAVRIFIGVTNPASLYAAEPIPTPTITPAAMAARATYAFDSDPFTLGEIIIPQDTSADAPETTLNLTLMGMSTGTNGGTILRLADNREARFAVGDEISRGVELVGIFSEYVTLSVNGEIQRLTFERAKKAEGDSNRISSQTVSASPKLQSSSDFLGQVGLRPKRENGRVIGYQLTPRSGVDISTYGFQSGDILTRVGDYNLTSNRLNMMELASFLKTTNGVDVEYLRDGKTRMTRIGR